MPGSSEKIAARPKVPERRWAIAVVVLAVALVAAGISVYSALRPSGTNTVKLQWSTVLTDQAIRGIHQHSGMFRTALDWDLRALIPGYVAGLLLACGLGRRVFWTPRCGRWATLAMAAAGVAGACNIVQDLLLLRALSDGLPRGGLLDWAEVLSFVMFAALLVAAPVGIVAITVSVGRLAMSKRTRERWENARPGDGTAGEPLVIPPPVIERAVRDSGPASGRRVAGQEWWDGLSKGPRARWAQGFASPSERFEKSIGVCVSGGGIRSASVALGALQALREEGILGQAKYLVSVSGGGYTAGGLQLALTRATDGQAPVTKATPDDTFEPGSLEEDHLRRHSSYIADGLGQWLVALGVLLRGVLSSLVIIGLTITTLGLAIGEFYTAVPIAVGGDLAKLRPRFAVTGPNPKPPTYPAIPFGVWCAIAVAGGLTLIAYLARQLTVKASLVHRTSRIAVALLAVTILLAALGVALPALLWASAWVTSPLGFGPLRAASLSSLSLFWT